MRLSLTARIALLTTANVALAIALTVLAQHAARAWGLGGGVMAGPLLALALSLVVALYTAAAVGRRVTRPLNAISDGIRAFRGGDYSVRLHVDGNDEVSELIALYNGIGELLRTQHHDVYEKELMLDTILQRTPVAVVLIGGAERVVYSNSMARELLAGGGRIDGRRFDELTASLVEPLRNALAGEGNSLLSILSGEQEETFHLSQRRFAMNTQPHRLVLLERLTPELRRQEVEVWKKAIRLMNHELNNSIAPISSLFHSARRVQERPDQQHRLEEIYETIGERLSYLRSFLESYAQFARLPAPRKERTLWQPVLDDVHALYPFRVEGRLPEWGVFDRTQLQQVLINLVKNAHEAGSAPDEVTVSISRANEGTLLTVRDRGKGMDEPTMRRALLPFYSTKAGGSGIGLALCNEIVEAHGGRLNLQSREGGGAVVTCWLPV